jgi:hypothetical protein
MERKNTIEDVYEMINDEKTYKILDSIRNGEKSTKDILSDVNFSMKPFNYLVKRMFLEGILVERSTWKTRFYGIDKEGLHGLIERLKELPETSAATEKLSKYL